MTRSLYYFIGVLFNQICRHILVGITVGCAGDLPQVFTNFMSKSVVNFVKKVMEDISCEQENCGIKNDGAKLNQFPWFVAIREEVNHNNVYRTGTLVSRQYVLTAATIFENKPVDKKNLQALVGATAYELNIANAYPEGMIPFISNDGNH